MTEGFWPAADRFRLTGTRVWPTLQTVVAFLCARPPAAVLGPLGDAWLRTHVRVRIGALPGVHEVMHRTGVLVTTRCGFRTHLSHVIFTAAPRSCRKTGCSPRARTPNRPAPVDRPGGADKGVAAKKTSRRHATGNSVADRTAEDSFRSVKSATDNRAMIGPRPRRQVVTAAQILQRVAETNSPGKARSRRPPRA